ncbi:ATP11 protein-domain-containing protein [Lipomyces kononenkoae]|uniref:ATP11 protein-domain-containing protein n=1 Tax=Lipomyces kononenkoae TaxID=34357 RepID=A0ACC3T540_LIPKO
MRIFVQSLAAIRAHLTASSTYSLPVKPWPCVKQCALFAPRIASNYSTVTPRTLPADIPERYRDKLEKLMREKNIGTLEELKQHYNEDITRRQTEERLAQVPFKKPRDSISHAGENTPKTPREKAIKTLSSYVDIEKLSQHTDIREIELIWRARHAHDPFSLCAVLDVETFQRMKKNAQTYPMFVLPLPRSGGAVEIEETTMGGTEMQFVQWAFPEKDTTHCLLTSLLEYKMHTEFARPHTTLIFHAELSKSRGVVLLNGTVEKDVGISPADAQLLVLALQKFYNSDPKGTVEPYEREKALRRRMLLELFKSGAGFDVKDLIRESEMVD